MITISSSAQSPSDTGAQTLSIDASAKKTQPSTSNLGRFGADQNSWRRPRQSGAAHAGAAGPATLSSREYGSRDCLQPKAERTSRGWLSAYRESEISGGWRCRNLAIHRRRPSTYRIHQGADCIDTDADYVAGSQRKKNLEARSPCRSAENTREGTSCCDKDIRPILAGTLQFAECDASCEY